MPRPEKEDQVIPRLQATIDKDDWELIRVIQKLCNFESTTEVVQEALVVLSWAATEAAKGYVIAAVDEPNNRFKELETRAMQRARARGSQINTVADAS